MNELVLFVDKETLATLMGPEDFLQFQRDELPVLFNGCGPKGMLAKLIPDSVLGVSLKLACYIHDHMYTKCTCKADEDLADLVFGFNVISLVLKSTENSFLRGLRLMLVSMYIRAVACTNMSNEYWQDNLKNCLFGPRYNVSRFF
jgi:hypothetical protein